MLAPPPLPPALVDHAPGPLLTLDLLDAMRAAFARGERVWPGSLDLGRSHGEASLTDEGFAWRGMRYPWPGPLRPRTLYAFDGEAFVPVSRYAGKLIKLVPTEWGVPTFEIDGIKMNPWSPDLAASGGRLSLAHADVAQAITALPDASFDVALHDPPRFGIAGELYARSFYDQLARVLRPGARLFHYTGSPNKLTSGRDVPGEVARRLAAAGFRAERALDGVLAIRR